MKKSKVLESTKENFRLVYASISIFEIMANKRLINHIKGVEMIFENKLIKKEAALLRDLLRKLNALKRSISASELRRKGELHQHLKSLTRDMKYLEELVKDTHSSPTEKRVAV